MVGIGRMTCLAFAVALGAGMVYAQEAIRVVALQEEEAPGAEAGIAFKTVVQTSMFPSETFWRSSINGQGQVVFEGRLSGGLGFVHK